MGGCFCEEAKTLYCCNLAPPNRYTFHAPAHAASKTYGIFEKSNGQKGNPCCKLFWLRVYRLGFFRTRGLAAKCCAVPVWKLSFVLILGHWPHIGAVPQKTLGCLGAGRPPKGGPGASKRKPKTTQTASVECLWGALGGRASRGGPGASRRQPRRPKMGLPPQRRADFLKTPKHDEH